jgi:hypothetical protein
MYQLIFLTVKQPVVLSTENGAFCGRKGKLSSVGLQPGVAGTRKQRGH